ncbi:MAG: hypothetical protein ACRDRL_00250 [Sciscionella sp.]
MPENVIKARGGAVKWRTIKLPNGKYAHVAVVRKAGPRGGHTVAGHPFPAGGVQHKSGS